MFQVINNFLNNYEFHSIKKIVTNDNFPWYLSKEDDVNFSHDLVYKSKDRLKTSFWITPILSPLLRELKKKEIEINLSDIKAKLILSWRTNEIIENEPKTNVTQIDLNDTSQTVILYLNTNNGYTQIVGSNKIESVENRVLIFPTNTSHFEATNTDSDYRMLLKLVYKT